ncbi:MAG: AAA family ATPase [Anaerolineales bacterium]|nr:AAA family ATPase [Anaerolineales bacterium]
MEDYFERLRRLLELEADAEKQAALRTLQRLSPVEAEASGHSLIQLVVRDEGVGLGGRCLLTLGKRNQTLTLPWTRLRVGTPVLLIEEGQPANSWRGVVSRLHKETIQIALPHWPEPEAERPTFRLDLASDEIARQRQRQALEQARAASTQMRLGQLRTVLLGQQAPHFQITATASVLDETLNAPQQAAVQWALAAEDYALIHGPPGTGKTTTLVAFIRQVVANGQTVLACAPSNVAVDNVLEKLVALGVPALRLGHPARVSPAVREHTLDLLVESHAAMRRAEKLTREAYALRDRASKFTRARPQPGAKQALRQEAKELLAEARQIEAQLVERLLHQTPVVCATLTGLEAELLGARRFDWCVMDEASQSTEPSAWIPLLRAERLVLAGDPCQLPPTVISPEALAQGFNLSLMERLMHSGPSTATRQLTVQYRMPEELMEFSSQEFYAGALVAAEAVRQQVLSGLPNVAATPLTTTAASFIDTAGAGYDEVPEPDGESRLNPAEAELVIAQVTALLAAGLRAEQIAVITPYSAQARLLREQLKNTAVEIDSVDGFQGREQEAVIVSLVRSNREGEIGFLSDVRRMNVALTRARRKLIVIGDSSTIAHHPFYQRWVDYFQQIGAYQSVWELS